MQKHTPGPWAKALQQTEDHQEAIVSAKTGKVVACAFHSDSCDLSEEEKANAALIAAAPDLAEALLLLIDATIQDDIDYGIVLTEKERIAKLAADLALEKATISRKDSA